LSLGWKRRYLEFLAAIEDPRNGRNKLDKLSQPRHHEGRSYPGFNFFDADDGELFCAIARGEFNIAGMQNKTLRRFLSGKTSSQISRLLKRLPLHGLIKKVAHGYKYYLTQFGKQVITTGQKLRELANIPQLAIAQAA
jgi:hypothetical protein